MSGKLIENILKLGKLENSADRLRSILGAASFRGGERVPCPARPWGAAPDPETRARPPARNLLLDVEAPRVSDLDGMLLAGLQPSSPAAATTSAP